MLTLKQFALYFILLLAVLACEKQPVVNEESKPTVNPLFSLLPADSTNIHFKNTLVEALNTNVLMYEYFYNGGGVAIGDVNKDGLEDIYFSSNMEENALYLNKGEMKFEDVTKAAGVQTRKGPWKTGVTIADVNGDTWLDIYVCYSGNLRPERRANELYINKGVNDKGIPRFEEEAKAYGLANTGSSTQGLFFDYDNDNDLDMILLNHNINALPVLNEKNTAEMLKAVDPNSGIRFFKNNNGFFDDITVKAGISSSSLTYGLGAGVADFNNDGWIDMYISNDYNVPDYLYINNKDGSFTNALEKSIGHTSHFSMGNDVADINNDALPDIFTLDMLPEDNRRQKLLLAPDNYGKFDLTVRVGFHYQYMRNMLQLNNGNGTFSEIGQLAGVSNTDWSWAPLLADYDNDGWKDLFVTNGYLRDYTNMDFIKYMDDFVQQKGKLSREDVLTLLHKIPASNVVNYIFKNNGDLTFNKSNEAWGITQASNSNGAAYADLDNDGDLDLIVNNVNLSAFIYRNETNKQIKQHFLKIQLAGNGKNTFGYGAKVTLISKGKKQFLQHMPARGYQSNVSQILHFGLDKQLSIDTVAITWLSGKQQMLKNVTADQLLVVKEADAVEVDKLPVPVPPIFQQVKSPINFAHDQPNLNDFKRQPLMLNPNSYNGPCLAKGDVNGDALDDVFAGGADGQPSALYLQTPRGEFVKRSQRAFDADKIYYDTDAIFLDVNKDGFQDLYVCSGGYHDFMPEDSRLQDRLYINDGKGNFSRNHDALSTMFTSTSCVRSNDVNNDGYPDLFIGSHVIPGRYPEVPKSYLLLNDGHGNFTDITLTHAPMLAKLGMVTDALWIDLDNNQQAELIVVGAWMPITILSIENGKLIDKTTHYFQKKYAGLWNKIVVGDFNNDNTIDLIVGNLGLNSQCKASDAEPATLYYHDFDNNGSIDPILCLYIQGKRYPYISRDELLEQIGSKRKVFPDYKSYADATLQDIFSEEELKNASHLTVNSFATTYFMGSKNGRFQESILPKEVQMSPVHTITSLDYNKDGNTDLLMCGNINQARLRFGKYDANYGVLLTGDGKGSFRYMPQGQSGFVIRGDVRSVIEVNGNLIFGINNGQTIAYRSKVF